jgi:hypothetical protein
MVETPYSGGLLVPMVGAALIRTSRENKRRSLLMKLSAQRLVVRSHLVDPHAGQPDRRASSEDRTSRLAS